MMKPWHEDDRFWRAFANSLFSPPRWEAAISDVAQICALTGLQPGASVLDMPCGTGRHALEFARHGFRVTGLDRTPSYLAEARERSVHDHLDVEWIEGDMRQFCRPEAFDAALNLFTSFGYFEDPAEDRAVAENFCRSLRPGGVLILGMVGKETVAREFRPRDWRQEADGSFLLEERHVHPGWDWIDSRWILVAEGQVQEFTISHRLYSAAEIAALLRDAGFASVESYGDFGGAPYDHLARRLVVVARR